MTLIDDLIRLLEAAKNVDSAKKSKVSALVSPKKKKRKVTQSPYKKAYSAAFKKIAPKNKTKKGKWKKDGFKRTQKAAHAEARRKTK